MAVANVGVKRRYEENKKKRTEEVSYVSCSRVFCQGSDHFSGRVEVAVLGRVADADGDDLLVGVWLCLHLVNNVPDWVAHTQGAGRGVYAPFRLGLLLGGLEGNAVGRGDEHSGRAGMGIG